MFPIRSGIQLAETPTVQAMVDQCPGVDGIKQTLAIMRKLKDAYKIHPIVRGLAMSLIAQIPQKDYRAEIHALTDYVKNNVRYTRDVAGVETLQTPTKTLEFGQGDCDDKSTLLAAMLESIGHKCRFRAVGMRKGNFCHVFPEVQYAGQWLSLETTEPVAVGWAPPGIVENLTDDGSRVDGFMDSLKSTFHKSVTLSTHLATHPLNAAGNIKEGAAIVAGTPGVDKIMKIKGLSTVLTVIGYAASAFGFPELSLAMTYIGYALDAAKAATAIDASVKIAETAGKTALPDGTSLTDARAAADKLRKDAANSAEVGNRIIDIDKAANLVIYSGLTALGAGAYYYYRKNR